jgi:serine phosphatase RsbU (regulator of sigma subunit)
VLKSERLRIRIVLGTIVTALLILTGRVAIAGGHENWSSWIRACGLASIFVVYEANMLLTVGRALRRGRDLANWVWTSNIILETFLPALAMVLLRTASVDPVYRPLVNPAALAFFLFIILSTLRLNPALCEISGSVAAVSYLLAAIYLGWKPSVTAGTSLLSPQRAVFGYAIAFLLSGFVAAVVAREIRKQVEAGLREAEARHQVQRLEHDLALARSIQQSLLPSTTPRVEGFQIAGWNQPADQTGGDYYDYQVLPDGKIVVAVADVTGHGVGPALLAAACRAYARASFRFTGGMLNIMEQINAALAADVGEGRFVTFVAALVSPGSSSVELFSAGHGPLFLYLSNEDRFDQIDSQGPPFGIFPVLVSEPPQILELRPGDLLVLATDGFCEWPNSQGELFGSNRLEEAIRRSRKKTARELISDLYQAVLEFSGGTRQQDDLTVAVIKRTEPRQEEP